MLKDERTLIVTAGTFVLVFIILIGALVNRGRKPKAQPEEQASPVLAIRNPEAPPKHPRRPIPPSFKRDSHMPESNESDSSGSIDLSTFSAGRDLIYFKDDSIWWESDNDNDDIECDHSMHRSMEAPLQALCELVNERGGRLKVQDAYRATGVHGVKSLHREGRGIDVTCEELGLEMLARLCWAAGFDWVYYEASSKGGPHVHCSVKR
ncbi:MAG: hypothetical protein O3C57_02780 [Verrucomicrobia bacterium]|nr:hypothetical protein [Verrucomicrobiota bacterium]